MGKSDNAVAFRTRDPRHPDRWGDWTGMIHSASLVFAKTHGFDIEYAYAEAAQASEKDERAAFEAAMKSAGYGIPKRGPFKDSQYLHGRDEDRFVGWRLGREAVYPQSVTPAPSDAMRRCLGFFASVIKSGETWTETCEREYRAALESQPVTPESHALDAVVSAVRRYLPPDGISKEQFIREVILAVDNPETNRERE